MIIYETFSFHCKSTRPVMQPGNVGSISRLRIIIEIQDKGTASAELVRYLAPLTIGTILKRLPLQDRVHRYVAQFVYLETGLIIGPEKQKSQFHRGDIAYLTSNSSFCVFVQDAKVQPMNSMGQVTSNLEIIESSRPGDIMIVKGASV
ncbi:MAG: cyclophilin-like fold protein [Nitrososphaera sp.]